MYSQSRTTLFIHLFADGQADLEAAGQTVTITQRTDYPWKEEVRIDVLPESPATFTLALRLPGWCRRAELKLNGKRIPYRSRIRKGYVKLRRRWEKGDRVDLRLGMPVERVEAHPAVRENAGRVALQRGPVVYCFEEADNGKNLHDLCLPARWKPTVKKGKAGILRGIPFITGNGHRRDIAPWKGSLYRTARSRLRPCRVTAVPYFMWANRGEGEMLVWIREAENHKQER
jgi:hypothetical protein